MAIVVKKGWETIQLDVNNAFLHRDLYEETFMKPPQELSISDKSIVYMLKKSLYGLKQASRQWYYK